MVRCRPNPRALQRDRLTRLAHDRHAHKVLIPNRAARWIKVYPARAWNVDLDPSMGVAARDSVVVVKIQIAGNEPRGDSKRAQCRDHEHRKVATTPAPELQGLYRILRSLLVSRHVLEVLIDGLRQVDEQLASIGRSVLAEEFGGPRIELQRGS